MSYTLTKTDRISEVAEKSPRAIKLLTEYGLHCANCFLNQFDTIESGAQIHGMTDEEIETMVAEINEQITKEEKEASG